MNFQYDSNQGQDPTDLNIDQMLTEKQIQTSMMQNHTQDINPEMQRDLNRPIENPNGFDQETQNFITEVMQRVYAGEINLYVPSTLMNQPVYDSASEEVQGKADLLAISLCSKLRELKDLMEISGGDQLFIQPTYQASLLVQDIKYRKTEFENRYGDVFII